MISYLVTGGCGFIGQRVVRAILERNAKFVRIVDNLSYGKRSNLDGMGNIQHVVGIPNVAPKAKIQLIEADIVDAEIAEAACRNIDVVIHLAANTGVAPSVANPRFDCMSNVLGTLNCLEGARRESVKRFVFASSGATVGEVVPPIHENLPSRPVSPYGASKLAGEAYCSAYSRTFGIDTVALRFGNVYGPGSEHKESVVAKFIRHAFAGENLPIYGDGTQTRDFIFIDDLVSAVMLATSVDHIGGEIFQIASARETTLNELASTLCEAFIAEGLQAPPIDFQSMRLGDVKRNFADTTKARERLGWEPQMSLTDGLRQTVRWAIENRKANARRE